MNQDTIPTEAGIQHRAIDHQKGCYTGQEVIIRIRDRGHVNKELRGFFLGDTSPPASGHELFKPGRDKSVGWITSAVVSPAFGQTIALGYLQRGVELAEDVRMGGVDGYRVQAFSLSDEGWVLD
jgi:aminomethyltransferase